MTSGTPRNGEPAGSCALLSAHSLVRGRVSHLRVCRRRGRLEAIDADENVWLSQKLMAQLYDAEVPTINFHLKKVFEDSEVQEPAVVRRIRIPAADGKNYDTKRSPSTGEAVCTA